VLDFGFFVGVLAFRARVVDGDPGIGIRISRDVRDGAFGAAADPRPVGDVLLPGLRGEHDAWTGTWRAWTRQAGVNSWPEARAQLDEPAWGRYRSAIVRVTVPRPWPPCDRATETV
jgi:hypothetical protein